MLPATKKILASDLQLTKLFDASSDDLSLTQQSLKQATNLIQSGKHSPDGLLAIAFLIDDKSHAPSLALRCSSLLTFVGLRLQFNEHYLQHFVAGAYAAMSFAKAERNRVAAYHQFCQKRQLDIIQSLLKVAKVASSATPERYLQENKLTREQIWLIIMFCALNSKSSAFTQKIQPAVSRLSSAFHADLGTLINYPGKFLPGTAVNVPAGGGYYLYRLSLNTSAVWLTDTNQVVETPCQKLVKTDAPTLTLNRWQTLAARYIEEFTPTTRQLFPLQYPISRLPADLRSIISGLQDSNTDISALARRIENIPVFAAYLKETASTDNRLQLTVKDVKQAMLTYGMTRVADMLILRALSQRLHQRFFPLMPVFVRLSEVTAAVASELTVLTKSKQTPQTMALIATFSTAPLFTVAGFKTLKRWPKVERQLYNLNSLWKSETQSFSEMSTALARQWQQPPLYQGIISHCGRELRDIPGALKVDTAIISLATMLARLWLFGVTPDSASSKFQQQSYALLGINDKLIGNIQGQLSPLLWLPYTQRP